MLEFDCGTVPVVDDVGRLVGLNTDRDICAEVYTEGQPLSARSVDARMIAEEFVHVPVLLFLAVVATVLVLSVVASLLTGSRRGHSRCTSSSEPRREKGFFQALGRDAVSRLPELTWVAPRLVEYGVHANADSFVEFLPDFGERPGHLLQVLHPFEVAGDDSTTIGKNVREHGNLALA